MKSFATIMRCSINQMIDKANALWSATKVRSNQIATVLACLLLMAPATHGGTLALSTTPPVGGGNEPRPNVIVTVDDSGSMAQKVDGTDGNPSKMSLLKSALTAAFSTTAVPDDRIRLAWQSLHDNGNSISNNGASSIKLGAKNSMMSFSGQHRSDFTAFINSLTANSDTPSMDMMRNVHDYMNAPANVASPWADNPAATSPQSTPYLSCRRTFHIFMTDGLWNSQTNPSCSSNGTMNANTNPPSCDNSGYVCPSGYKVYQNSTGPANACRSNNKIGGSYQYSALVYASNTSVYITGDRVAYGDGVTQTLPDGTVYNPATSNNQVKAYRDLYGDDLAASSTLSDFVFANWSRDLQDGNPGTTQTNSAGVTISGLTQAIDNNISPAIRKKGVETVTAGNKSTDLTEYWNPKNDPATWQHISQYTIGFGNDATNWGTTPLWDTVTNDTFGGNGDYAKLVNGTVTWPNVQTSSTSNTVTARAAELWHGAINGRGKYIPAGTGDALTQAFADILTAVLVDTSKPLITVTTSSSTLRTGTLAYIAGYIGSNWAGQLMARNLDPTDASILPGAAWDAAELIDSAGFSVANRFVLSSNKSTSTSPSVGFSWATLANLPTAQQTPMSTNSSNNPDSNGQNRVNYIRGDSSKELAQAGGIFRDRGSRLGDIVNSNLWYLGKPASGYTANGYATFRGTGTGGKGGRTPMVYIGSNDGMLHGFVAAVGGTIAGGTELLAYIPQGIAEGPLRTLTDTNYVHKYMVDGSPFSGDAYITTPISPSTSAWATVLVGTLGAGGKGFFILDATDPANFIATNASNLVIADTTGGTVDADIGVMISQPVVDDAIASKSRQVVQMNNGRWAVVFGNGYNSTNEAPVLLIQYLDGDKSIKKISPCASPIATTTCSFKGTNGLSSPQLIDLNGDGRVDVAYAGDLQGNLWKFNLTNASDANWSTSFNNQPFFVAKGPGSAARPAATVQQAITSAPYWMPHPLGGIMISVGTGRNLIDSDRTSTATDTYYALWDKSTFSFSGNTVTVTDGSVINTTSSTALPTTTGGLVQQTITGTITADGTYYYSSSNNAVDYSTKRGWYIDLSLANGERDLTNTRLFTGETILVTTTVPKTGANSSAESCTVSASSEVNYLYLLNMFTGKQPTTPAFDLSGMTVTNTGTGTANIIAVGAGDTTMIEGQGMKFIIPSNTQKDARGDSTGLNMPHFPGRRVNWRQK
jgi:type IV pilus assembly protein PilY1